MDGADWRRDADVDHLTYGEVILAGSTDETVLSPSDWRTATAAPARSRRLATKRERAKPRAGTPGEQRERARAG